MVNNAEGTDNRSYAGDSKIRVVIVPSDITEITDSQFKDCKYLERVVFNCNSTIQSIDYKAFYGCKSLERVVFQDKLTTRLRYIGESAFENCLSLLKFFPDEMASRVEDEMVGIDEGETKDDGLDGPPIAAVYAALYIGQKAFANCKSLKGFNVNILTTTSETPAATFRRTGVLVGYTSAFDIIIDEEAFFNCSSLEHVNFVSNIKYMSIASSEYGEAYVALDRNLINPLPPSFEDNPFFLNCMVFGRSAFYGCKKLSTFNIKDWLILSFNAYYYATESRTDFFAEVQRSTRDRLEVGGTLVNPSILYDYTGLFTDTPYLPTWTAELSIVIPLTGIYYTLFSNEWVPVVPG
jgi:hypothetical protein